MNADLALLGDRAWRFRVPSLDRRTLVTALSAIEGITDVVLAEEYGAAILADETSTGQVLPALETALAATHAGAIAAAPALHTIRVAYDGEDLASLARHLDLTVDALIERHAASDYEVAMIGFMPGFAYLRGLDPRLVVARRDSPRRRVPARSVAIAAEYTGIYPFASPGGWHLLGEALDFMPFDLDGAALAVGDRVRFEAAARPLRSAEAAPPSPAPTPGGPWLEVLATRGPALLVDGGRLHHMHDGVPHGGPMVRRGLARANAAVDNPLGGCAIEAFGELELVARAGPIVVGDDLDGSHRLEDGETFTLSPRSQSRVRYVAVRGGFDVPLELGGRGTLLVARLGGYEGRALRKGDRLSAGPHTSGGRYTWNADAGPDVALAIGPDSDEGEIAELLGKTFVVASASDRTGTRLEGPPLRTSVHSTHDRKSEPMVRGAIQKTPSGLIVLGPDHPTTGGYPVIAVVRERSMDRFFGTPLGHEVRFVVET